MLTFGKAQLEEIDGRAVGVQAARPVQPTPSGDGAQREILVEPEIQGHRKA